MGVIAKQILYIKEESGFVPIGTLQGDKGSDGKSIYQICLDHGYTGTEEDIDLYVSKLPEIYEKLYGNEYHFNKNQNVYIHDDDIFYAGRSITEMFKEYESRIRSMETESTLSQSEMIKAFNAKGTIRRVIFTENAPSPDIETKDVRDITNSTIPIVTWFDNTDDTQYIYTDADIILYPNDAGKIFVYMDNLEYIDFGRKIDSSGVTNMSLLLYNNPSLKQVLNLQRWNTSNVTNMMNMFYNCSSLENLNEQIQYFDTSKVTSMTSMFGLCKFTNSELDLSHFDVSNVGSSSYGGMFSEVTLEKLIWHNGKFIQSSPFGQAGLQLCKTVDLTGSTFATQYPGFTSFYSASIENLILRNVDFSAVTSMAAMFPGLSTLKHIDLINIDTSHITNMASMFSGDSSLTDIDLSTFSTESCAMFSYMFNQCTSLSNITYGDKFILPDEIKSMLGYDDDTNPTYCMFNGCPANKPNWTGGTWTENGTYIFQS